MYADRIKGIIGILGLVLLIGLVASLATRDLGEIFNPKSAVETILTTSDEAANPDDREVRPFQVRTGDSASSISERLQAAGLVKNALAFRLMAESKGVAGDLAVGEYELSPSMRPSEILELLSSGKIKAGPMVTIPEGWRAEEIGDRLAARGVGTAEAFMGVVRVGKTDSPLVSKRPEGASLEGYLFPDTYRTDSKTTPEEMVARMVGQFEAKFTPDMRQKSEARGMTIHQIVTLASIIEREAVVPSERPVMAAVFYNRLRRGMRLDTDPTVQYAVAAADPSSHLTYGWWKIELTQKDLEIDSPYNTYKNAGLPPGPICEPGLASLNAAISPASNDYLYFVAKPDGSHAFATTLEEHNQNVAKYRR